MTVSIQKSWVHEFGLDGQRPPTFFANPADIDAAGQEAGQAHVLRRAFEAMQLDGVLCHDSAPIIYFRLVDDLSANRVTALHRTFWNQGVAPILVLIAPDEVHIYSSLSDPALPTSESGSPAGFIERLERVADRLQEFILAVDSREYFREHRPAFDPAKRVDRNLLHNLEATRSVLGEVPSAKLEPETLNALLCRLVFTCYLFDRKVIDRKYLEQAGIHDAEHLRDILGRKRRSEAKTDLYALFAQLGQDFNGDLFSEDLEAEARQIRVEHLEILNRFFRGTDARGQQSFWPYEFDIIPIETISAIYEHFLKAAGAKEKKESAAFYTPRFLAELVLDRALAGVPTLLDKRFLDPACGSGIFLVGLFNRLAEEWSRLNLKAGYDARLKALTTILTTNLYGIDKSRTACLITAFSLYLAFLDQLSPPDIRRVLKKVKVLPRLVSDDANPTGTIRHADFFTEAAELPEKVDFVIGNPPWAKAQGAAAEWCITKRLSLPGKQLAAAFVWKAADHLSEAGKTYLVLPHGLLFNHTESAVEFQKTFFRTHAVEIVLNLADYQRFLFEEAEAPALIIGYAKAAPADSAHRIDYWSPKADWAATQAEVITILPQDRACLTVREVLNDLRSDDAPLIWKDRYWATFRDRRLLDRLRLYPRLRDVIGQRGKSVPKRWIIAEGFEPFGVNDHPDTRRSLRLHNTAKIERGTHRLALVLLQEDCEIRDVLELDLRRAISNPAIFQRPLVLIKTGYSTNPEVAFADFNVAYRHGTRGVHGPSADSKLLAFLTFYLRSRVAGYFLFHTAASWGVSRAFVDIDDLMRLPFPLPDQSDNPARAEEIIHEAGEIMAGVMKRSGNAHFDRDSFVRDAQARAELLVEEYLDIDDIERMLIDDTMSVIIPSVRPTRKRVAVPTLLPAKESDRTDYATLLCATLNQWASDEYEVHGKAVADVNLGIGMIVLEKTLRGHSPSHLDMATKDVLATLQRLQRIARSAGGRLELARGLKVFDKTLLYITKPIGLRFWTRTSALNDADEIADTLLMRSAKEGA